MQYIKIPAFRLMPLFKVFTGQTVFCAFICLFVVLISKLTIILPEDIMESTGFFA